MRLALLAPVLLLGSALGSGSATAQSEPKEVTIKNGRGEDVGRAIMREKGDRIQINVRVTGLSPGSHGMHLHAVGLCEGPGFPTAGAHLNPAQLKHGRKNPQGFHLGDLPNLQVGKGGKGNKTVDVTGAEARSGFKTFLGTSGLALVIHADRDDELTDPTGNSGARIACAVFLP